MKHKDYITVARKNLGVDLTYESMDSWSRLAGLDRDYGHEATLAAFESWSLENRGKVTKYAISAFCFQGAGIISGIISLGPNPELDTLSSELYEIAECAFTGKARMGLADLMKSYTAEEIKKAYKEYTDSLDAYKLARAPKDFIEGGAVSILLAIKKKAASSPVVDAAAAARQLAYEIEITKRKQAAPDSKVLPSESDAPDDLTELLQ